MDKGEISFQTSDVDISLTELESDSTDFVQTLARSISELQPSVDDVCDVMVFIEVLGYSEKDAMSNGFKDLYDLAKHVFTFVDHYAIATIEVEKIQSESRGLERPSSIKSGKKRTGESLIRAFPWIASLVILYVFGVSLWMTFILPLALVTALIAGVFTGLAISEGPSQLFGRIFYFYHEQGNTREVERILKRMFRSQSMIILFTAIPILVVGFVARIPYTYLLVTCGCLATISATRIGYVLLYSLNKLKTVVLMYGAGLASLLLLYFFGSDLIPMPATRYFISLFLGFGVLSLAPVYYFFKLRGLRLRKRSSNDKNEEPPHFFKPPSNNIRTISSRFSVQLWEGALYLCFGTLFFFLIFGDRIISWFANSEYSIFGGLIRIPLFNSTYSMGADLALIALFPAYIITFVMMDPIYQEITGLTLTHSLREFGKLNAYLAERYRRTLTLTVGVSFGIASLLAVIGPTIISDMDGGSTTISIFYIALIGNIFMSVFFVNSQFLVSVLKRNRFLVILATLCVLILFMGGSYMARWGLQYITISYLISAAIGSMVSTAAVKRNLKNSAMTFLAG